MAKCAYPHCRGSSCIVYLGRPLCEKHWDIIAEDDSGKYAKKIGIIKVGKEWVPKELLKKEE